MPYHDCFFSAIIIVEFFPDPDQVFFLLLLQRHIRIHPCVTEKEIPASVIQRQVPGVIQPVLQRFGT